MRLREISLFCSQKAESQIAKIPFVYKNGSRTNIGNDMNPLYIGNCSLTYPQSMCEYESRV